MPRFLFREEGGWSRRRKVYEMWKNRRIMIRKMEEEEEGTWVTWRLEKE